MSINKCKLIYALSKVNWKWEIILTKFKVHLSFVPSPAYIDSVVFIKVHQWVMILLHTGWWTDIQEEAISTASYQHKWRTQNCCKGQKVRNQVEEAKE